MVVDRIIRISSTLQNLFNCGPCNGYLIKQMEFERNSQDSALPMEMKVYQTFLSDE
jgi:hypothetical protein